jgi:hypothetical protein
MEQLPDDDIGYRRNSAGRFNKTLALKSGGASAERLAMVWGTGHAILP